jgi:C-terminal processing protease CtpA/Prc
MKNSSITSALFLMIFVVSIFTACVKEEKEEEDPKVEIKEASEVNQFVWHGLKDYYLWTDKIANLSNPNFEKSADSLNVFLNKYIDPEDLFIDLLYQYEVIDKWSFIVDNAQEIDDWIAGISETMGYDFGLGRIGSSDNIFGFVRYVYDGSPAEKAGIKRGDIFMTVNDQQLTVSNYQTLLYKTLNYKLGFATIGGGTISPSTRTVTMTAVKMQENPINLDTVFVYNNQKVGYLVYNGFNADFDLQLNSVMKKFKDANIDQMILDLRYNGGGSVRTSAYFASMLYGTDATKIFAKSQYNAGLQDYYLSKNGETSLNTYFTPTIAATSTSPATAINTLNLKKIYIIASENTASASELIINGLRPYMNVVVVGTNTHGKYTASATIEDWDDMGKVNPNHTYAMQPIIAKYANSLGVSDFVNGLVPNIQAEELVGSADWATFLPFGNPNEKLLSVVLADIKGLPTTAMTMKSAGIKITKVADSHKFKRFANEMYINDFPRNLKMQISE